MLSGMTQEEIERRAADLDAHVQGLRARYLHQYNGAIARPHYWFEVVAGEEPEEGVEFPVTTDPWSVEALAFDVSEAKDILRLRGSRP